ncbi:hypothetical protein CJF42_12370 [Pseudoalteromonas sp. NBT06-2]|uniref:restriction endonuclease subunit S n=1 Tax=Pseudoalteromonas sp. NBT06-2 TaxID=2025950 RepID=UPI000BA6FC14|nr:restriction endonuclease subunit S [Pseudoalteromonas sp. NBT06-2]PAJ74101.1 hypothetical protein CJF42_12370 [Pseudoalteromonas sp. NBT06-2]
MTQLVPIELGEFCKVDSGFAFKSEQFSDDCNDVFLVKGSNLGHRQIKWDEGPWWNVDDYEKFERYQLREQDVLLAMDRPIVGGQLKYSWIKEGDPKALLVQRVARLRAIKPEDQKFLRYVIASPAFLQYIDTITTGVNVPHISGPDIRKYKFNLPEKGARLKIAEIIDAYDNLIENNLKRIKLLEEMAQITYEEWFVRMNFPGHETVAFDEETGLPEGWNNTNLSEAIQINPTTKAATKELAPYVPMGSLSTSSMIIDGIESRIPSGGAKFKNGDTLVARITPCLENGKTGFVDFLLDEQVATGSTEFIVLRESPEVNRYFIYCLARSDYFRGFSINNMLGSDGRQRVNHKAYEKYLINIPPKNIMEDFEQLASPAFSTIKSLVRQKNLLREARDILLPRLMTCMIDIEQVELPEAMLQRLELQEAEMAEA